jgi:hypothetical protein
MESKPDFLSAVEMDVLGSAAFTLNQILTYLQLSTFSNLK